MASKVIVEEPWNGSRPGKDMELFVHLSFNNWGNQPHQSIFTCTLHTNLHNDNPPSENEDSQAQMGRPLNDPMLYVHMHVADLLCLNC